MKYFQNMTLWYIYIYIYISEIIHPYQIFFNISVFRPFCLFLQNFGFQDPILESASLKIGQNIEIWDFRKKKEKICNKKEYRIHIDFFGADRKNNIFYRRIYAVFRTIPLHWKYFSRPEFCVESKIFSENINQWPFPLQIHHRILNNSYPLTKIWTYLSFSCGDIYDVDCGFE